MCKGCLKELERLIKHYKAETSKLYTFNNPDFDYIEFNRGIIIGLKMATRVLKNKEYYGDK